MAAKRRSCDRGNVGPSRSRNPMRGPNSSKTKPVPHFFKMIVQSTLDSKKLKIPKQFVQIYGRELSSIATISLPDGSNWKLGLEKANGRISFAVGWQRFIRHYSIRKGYCLVFRYEEFSKFHVYILDASTTEIDYSDNDQNGGDSEDQEVEATDDDDDDEEEEEEKEGDDFEINPRFSYKRTIIFNESVVGQTRKRKKMHSSGDRLLAKDEDGQMFISQNFSQIKISKKSERAIQAAKKCKRTNPCFMVVLQKFSVEHYNNVNVPAEFVKKYMNNCSEYITLETSSGKRQWLVRCTPIHKRRWPMKISRGWSAFRRDNSLKKGDICVFELMKKNEILLKISIYRAAEYAH